MEFAQERSEAAPKKKWKTTCLSAAYAIWTIYLISLLYFASALRTTHRNFLSIVQAPIQRELKVSDELFGSITGPIFSFSHALAGLVFGRMIDTYPRKIILIIMIISWTTFNCLHGLISKPWHLVAVRIGLASSMAGVPSCALSLIGDLVSKQRRAVSIAFYNSSFVLAVSGPYIFGLFLDDKSSNWRSIFFYMGVPGIALTLLAFLTFTEPERGNYDVKPTQPIPLWETVKLILKCPSMWFICLSAGFSFMAANATNVWGPAFYLRVHGMPVKELSKWLAWISPIAGIIGTFLGGWLADQLQKYTDRGYAMISLVAVIIGTPLQILVFLVPSAIASILISFPSLLVGFMVVPILYLIPIQVVPSSMRATAVSWLMVFIGLIGSFGPMLVGFLNRINWAEMNMVNNPKSIQWSLLILWTVCNGFLFVFMCCLFFSLPHDLKKLRDWEAKLINEAKSESTTVEENHQDLLSEHDINITDHQETKI